MAASWRGAICPTHVGRHGRRTASRRSTWWCVNLYPVRATVAKPDCTLEDAIENIDIGGPTMVRAAAKNHAHVAVVTDPADYAALLDEMQANGGALGQRNPLRPGEEGLLPHRRLRRRDQQLPDRARRQTAARSPSRSDSTCSSPRRRTALRREPAPAGAFYVEPSAEPRHASPPHASCRARNCPTTTSPMPMPRWNASSSSTQRRPASSSSTPTPAASPTAPTCWKPMTAPTRPIPNRPSAASSPSTASSMRQPRRPSSSASSSKSSSRPRSSAAASEVVAAKKNVRLLECGQWPTAAGPAPGLQARRPAACWCRTPTWLLHDELKVVTKRAPTAAGNGRPAVRLARGQVRQVQRHRLRQGQHDHRRRRRPDEPRQLRAHRRHQGRARRPAGARLGDGLGRLLPVPRRHRRGCRRPASPR